MFNVGNLLPAERVPDTDRIRLSTIPGIVPVFISLAAVLVVLALALLWLPSRPVMLTPAGITIRYPLRRRFIRWEDLPPGGPQPVSRWTMPLLYRTPDGRPKRLNVQPISFNSDSVFLATVVRRYVEHPEHRAAIGTPSERERLESAYAAWRSTPVTIARLA